MSHWDTNPYDTSPRRDRWTHPCSTCSGSGTVLRTERVSCGCMTRCSEFCDRKTTEMASRPCSGCDGSGVSRW